MIKLFKHLILFTKNGKQAQLALQNLSKAIDDTAIEQEVREILDGLLSSNTLLRICSLEALENLGCPPEIAPRFATQIWVSRFDEEEPVAALAQAFWDETESSIGVNYAPPLIQLLGSPLWIYSLSPLR